MDHCQECGFDFGAVPPGAVGERVRALPPRFAEQLSRAQRDGVARRRPQPETWSPLEYTCHVRDQRERTRQTLHEGLHHLADIEAGVAGRQIGPSPR